ncbi:MAG: hypothetical protein AAB116_01675 [Candidatus Poribacteria bacterium]
MKGYLSQIASRTNGMFEQNSIKSDTPIWNFADANNTLNNVNEDVSYLESDGDGFTDIKRSAFPPSDKPLPQVQSEIPKISPSFDVENNSSNVGKSNDIIADIEKPVIQISDRLLEQTPSETHEITPSVVKIEKPSNKDHFALTDKSENIDESYLKNTEEQASQSDSEDKTSIIRIPYKTRIIHREFQTGDSHLQMSGEEPEIEGMANERQSLELIIPKQSSPFSMRDDQPTQNTDTFIQEVSPRMQAIMLSIAVENDKEPNLVIGRIDVEVVTPPEEPQQNVSTNQHNSKPQSLQGISSYHSKLRFGLGQM